jgi:hypothetical protein
LWLSDTSIKNLYSFVDEIAFVRTNDKYGTRRFANNLFRRAAEENMLNAGVPVCRNDNELDFFILGE